MFCAQIIVKRIVVVVVVVEAATIFCPLSLFKRSIVSNCND